MAQISKQINGWIGSADIPVSADSKYMALYQLAMCAINKERQVLLGAYQDEGNGMDEAEYDAKTSILDDLASQYFDLLMAQAPSISWEQV